MPSMKLPMVSFQRELISRRVKLMQSHANRVARRLAVIAKGRIGMGFSRDVVLDSATLIDMARLHGVAHELWPVVVEQVRQLT